MYNFSHTNKKLAIKKETEEANNNVPSPVANVIVNKLVTLDDTRVVNFVDPNEKGASPHPVPRKCNKICILLIKGHVAEKFANNGASDRFAACPRIIMLLVCVCHTLL